MVTKILALFLVSALNFGVSSADPQLKHVIVTYRSQEHTPCDYPTGPKITGTPEDQSRLTETGKNNAYEFGQKLRDKYTSLLGTPSENDIYSIATRTPRTQQAAMIVGAGLLGQESKKQQEWSKEEGDKTVYPQVDKLTKFYSKEKCPAFFQSVKDAVSKPEFKEKVKVDLDAIKKVGETYKDVTVQKPPSVWLATETFNSQKAQGKLSSDITDDILNKLKHFSRELMSAAESTEKSRKLSGGVMVDDMLTDLKTLKDGGDPQGRDKNHKPKIALLAAPQGVLGAMIGAFNPQGTKYGNKETTFTPETFYPENGAHFIIEYYDDNGQDKIKVLYSPGDGKDLAPLFYDGCNDDGSCSYDQLEATLRNVRLPSKEQDKACEAKATLKKRKSS